MSNGFASKWERSARTDSSRALRVRENDESKMTRVQIEGAFAALNLRGGSDLQNELQTEGRALQTIEFAIRSALVRGEVLRDGIRVRRRKLIGCVRQLFAEIPVVLRVGVEDVEPAQRDRDPLADGLGNEAVGELVGRTVERVVVPDVVHLQRPFNPR